MTKILNNGDDEGYHSRRSKSCVQRSRKYLRHIGMLQINYCVWKKGLVCDMWEKMGWGQNL